MSFDTKLLEDSAIQLVDGDRGKNYPKQSDFKEDGYCLFLSAKNVTSSGFEFSETSFIDKEKDSILRAGKLKRGDIVVTTRGTIGNVAFYSDDIPFDNIRINSGMMIFRPNKNQWNRRFLYFLLTSNFIQQQVVSLTSGSAVPQLPARDLNKFQLPNIPREVQNSIEKMIGDITDKIELNRQTNQTLEQLAQAIFKSWFVAFEPTRAKIAAKENGEDPERAGMAAIAGKTVEQLDALFSEGNEHGNPHVADAESARATLENLKSAAALFPDRLVESELGEIPEGWEVKTFGDVSTCLDSKRIPLSKRQREEKKPGNIPYYGATSIMDYVNEWVFDDIYLLLGEDGSVIKKDGTPFIQYIWGKSWVNNHAHVLQGKNGVSTEQLMIFTHQQNIAAYITGAVQLKLNQGNMNSIPFLDAGQALNTIFHNLVSPLYEKLRNTIEENKTLEQTRNSLLPKLLSGELDLSSGEND